MGEIIDLQRYRARAEEHARNGLIMEIMPPVILLNYYEKGVLVEQHRIISEYLLRDMLDGLL